MAQHGITSGCGSNGFCPNDNVTRDEMAIFIVRAIYGSDNFTYTTTPYFNDVLPTTFGFKWIQKPEGSWELPTAAQCPLTVRPRRWPAIRWLCLLFVRGWVSVSQGRARRLLIHRRHTSPMRPGGH